MSSSKRSRRFSDSSEDDSSAPEYSVEEASNGLLVNHNKRLIWPSKKQISAETFNRLAGIDCSPNSSPELADVSFDGNSYVSDSSTRKKKKSWRTSSSSSLYELDADILSDKRESVKEPTAKSEISVGRTTSVIDDLTKYIGICTSEEAEIHADTTCFRLYHRAASGLEINTVLPLYIVYKNNSGQSVHYPIVHRQEVEDGGVCNYWKVDYGRASHREFLSLSGLVRYYGLYSNYDAATGAIEAFEFSE